MSSSRQTDAVDLDTLMEDRSQYGVAPDRLLEENQAALAALDQRKRARKLAHVPTDDKKVRIKLREFEQPVTLFGEMAADRYIRLRKVMADAQAAKGPDNEAAEGASDSGSSSGSDDSDEEEEFYTEPPLPDELLAARRKIARFSLPLSAQRLRRQKIESVVPVGKILDVRKSLYKSLKTTVLLGSQIGDTRPISAVRFSPDSKLIATGSWSGGAKVWEVPSLKEVKALKGHDTHCRGLAWHPQATLSMSSAGLNLATGGGEGTVKLWSLDSSTPLSTLEGHTAPVARVAFHPSGDYVASASFDGTWRLWDVATSQELLLQEGHSKEVYAVAWQDDGALVATGGLDAIGRVWDARTGRTVWVLDGHAKQITAMDWSPNGYQLATGSADDSIKIWDIRKLACAYTIPAHKSLVSDLKFFRDASERPSPSSLTTPSAPPSFDAMDVSTDFESTPTPSPSVVNRSGLYLVSSGYDSTVKIWSADDWLLVKSIVTDSGKVMGVDVDGKGEFLASGSGNRSFQLFGKEEAF